ncbi:MAG: hypothetical protein WAS05_03610 [Candidatus Nanopelagicales bacterium]
MISSGIESAKSTRIAMAAASATAALAFGLVSCSSPSSDSSALSTDPPAATATQNELELSLEQQQTLDEFFVALSAGTSTNVATALKHTATNSPARLFALHQTSLVQADPESTTTASVSKGSVSWSNYFNNESTTDSFTDFEFADSQHITTWKINGQPLSKLIKRLTQSKKTNSVTVKLSTAYRPTPNQLQVSYRLSSSSSDQKYIDVEGFRSKGRMVNTVTVPYDLTLGKSQRRSAISQAPIPSFNAQLIFEIDSDNQLIIPVK